jgi:outer membrane protein TolC
MIGKALDPGGGGPDSGALAGRSVGDRRARTRPRPRATSVALALALLGPAAASANASDPFGTERYISPAPHLRWEPGIALPAVSAPPDVAAAPGVRPLSLAELTELALRNNPRTRQAWFAARAAAAGVGIEEADRLPQIAATVLLQRSESGGQAGNQIPWLTRYGPSLTLSYLLFDFGVQESQVRAAEYLALAAALGQNRALQEVVLQVEQAYYRYLGAEQLVRSNELFLKSVTTSLEAARRRREAGLATVADVYRSETQVAQAQLNVARSRGELEKARGALAAAAGLPVDAPLRVQALEGEPRIEEVSASLEQMLARARTSRPDLVASEAQVRAARAQAEAASRAAYPTVSVSATTGQTYYMGERPRTDTNSIGLTLSIPLFSGYGRTYALRQAQARAAQAEAARDVLYRQAELEVWQAYYDVQTAARAIATTEIQLKAAQQTAEATLARYQAGFGTLLDLITAQVEELNARVQRIQSYLDWFTALARLNHAIGASDPFVQGLQAR